MLPVKSLETLRNCVNLQMYISLSIFFSFVNPKFTNRAYQGEKVLNGLIIPSALKKQKETTHQKINVQVL